ncbi:50S ribosomal protein L25 [Heliorestis convoluta]|uniref:Large ribosomal subunit protein bL25 n=1 Tax=Heliorestis convoluta TaxID=356322 RepID=A0A5Q2N468_9FIRM|nr:50S ribosomal protein L25 [Heliorestis convoluta]QGG48703.1 50S ribosomal protein L25 [Heliorestis convoluta]
MEVIPLKVQKRERGSRGQLNKMRNQGLLPAVLYGKQKDDLLLSVPVKDLQTILHSEGGLNSIIALQLEGQASEDKHTVVVRDIQRDPITRSFNHVDFQQINMNEVISAELPIHFVGESVGVNAGGVIQHGIRSLQVEGMPAQLPGRIDVDITQLDLHDKLFVRDIQAPEGIEITSDPEQVVLSIVVPRAVIEKEEVTETTEATADEERTDGAKEEEKEGE